MGRTKYSENERAQMFTAFLKATQEIINTEGMEQISIRKVAKIAGFNSATIYLYFQDVDELITMASMGYLEDYCRDLSENAPNTQSPYEMYLYTWKVFCHYAFTHPQIYYRLFYYAHSKPLDETVAQYYQIFPEFLENISGSIKKMLHAGSLENRNYQVLYPLAEAGIIDYENVNLINDMSLCYFRKILEAQCEDPSLDEKQQTEKVLVAMKFLLKK